MTAEEQGVLSGQGYVPVDSLDEIVVPRVVAAGRYGFYAISLVEHIVGSLVHLRLWRVLPMLRLDLEQSLLYLP